MLKKLKITFIGILLCQFAMAQNVLKIPSTLSGKNINLVLQNGATQFFNGQTTSTMGANGNILGPTLILNQGDVVNFSVENQLSDTTTLHWHGLHVSSEHDGGPHTTIPPNTIWSPSFTIMDKAATYWYHPHLHHFTDKHVSKGIAGMIIVKDNIEANLDLPRTYGVDDVPLVIQTKDFDSNNQIVVHSNADDIVMVNATIDPFLNVPSQIIRFRILNGSSQRSFNLGLSNNQPFYQIASDGGLLSAPVMLNRLLIAPGERAEILVDFSSAVGQTIYLKSFASELQNGIFGATNPGMGPGMTMNGYYPNPLNGTNYDIIQFNVGTPTADPIVNIPNQLTTVEPIPPSNANTTRTLTFAPVAMGPNQLNGEFLINGVSMDMEVINYTIPLNNTEIWELFNQSAIAHPFHIHDVQFYILSRNGIAPPTHEQGRKDVVLVRPMETVRFITKFEDFTNSSVPYMYHCHLLNHEDGGMMGQFLVTRPSAIDDESFDENDAFIYPNPSTGKVTIKVKKMPTKVIITDVLGRFIDADLNKNDHLITVDNLLKGINIITLEYNGIRINRKIIVN